MPGGDFIVKFFEVTQSVYKPIPESHLFTLLFLRLAPECKLPIVNSFIVGVPCKASAVHPILVCKLPDCRCAFVNHFVFVLVHIVRFHNELCAGTGNDFEQIFKRGQIVGTCDCRKGAPCQTVGNIRFQYTLGNIYSLCIPFPYEMNRTSRRAAVLLARGREPYIFGTGFVRCFIGILQRCVQSYLKAGYPSFHVPCRKKNACCVRAEIQCPFSILLIEARHTLNGMPKPNQTLGNRTAHIEGRGTPEPKAVDLCIGKSAHRTQMFQVLLFQQQLFKHCGVGLMDHTCIRFFGLADLSWSRSAWQGQCLRGHDDAVLNGFTYFTKCDRSTGILDTRVQL